jgi:hypothetical protein
MFSLPGAFNVIWHRSLVYLGRRKDSSNECLKAFCPFVLIGQTDPSFFFRSWERAA